MGIYEGRVRFLTEEEILANYEKYIERCKKENRSPLDKTIYMKRYKAFGASEREGISIPFSIDERIYKKFIELAGIHYGRKREIYKIIEILAEIKTRKVEETGIYTEITRKRCLETIGEDPNKYLKKTTSIKMNLLLCRKISRVIEEKKIAGFIRSLIHLFVCDEEVRKKVCSLKI